MQSENAPSSGQGPKASTRWSSLFRKKGTKSIPSDQPSRPEQPASSTSACRLETFETITVRKFIDCYLSGDRSILIIEGAADPETLDDAWLAIYSAYCSGIGNSELSALITRAKQAAVLRSKITRVSLAVEFARRIVAQEVIDVFLDYGISLDLSTSPDAYQTQLDNIIGRLQPEISRLQALEAQPGTDQHEPTEQDFRDVLFEIGKFQGFAAPHSMLLIDYTTALRKLQEYIQHQTNPVKNGRRALR